MPDHSTYMKLAAKQARKSLFISGDNPRVGCVMVNNGIVVGSGYTQEPGGHHAEIMALNEAGDKAKGATVYVTLEPCSFHGRTPPCADALIEAGVNKVIVGATDPHPKVSGNGVNKLRAAGIEVDTCPLSDKDIKLNAGFFKRMQTGLPLVRIKMAQSLDGRTAMANGDSFWITGKKARKDVQVWRGRSQAILSGVETVLADDCRLSVRPDDFPNKYKTLEHHFDSKQPMRIILDTHLRTPKSAKILSGPGRKVIMTAPGPSPADYADGVEIVEMPLNTDGRIDLKNALKWTGDQEINELLVECGATLAGAFMQERLADQLIVYTAPVIMGSSARPLFNFDIVEMSQRHHITNVKLKRLGKDWRILADA